MGRLPWCIPSAQPLHIRFHWNLSSSWRTSGHIQTGFFAFPLRIMCKEQKVVYCRETLINFEFYATLRKFSFRGHIPLTFCKKKIYCILLWRMRSWWLLIFDVDLLSVYTSFWKHSATSFFFSALNWHPLVRLHLTCVFCFSTFATNYTRRWRRRHRRQHIIPKSYVIPFAESETQLFIMWASVMNNFFCYVLILAVGRGPYSLDIKFHAVQIVNCPASSLLPILSARQNVRRIAHVTRRDNKRETENPSQWGMPHPYFSCFPLLEGEVIHPSRAYKCY
jgi:hypothetical protein